MAHRPLYCLTMDDHSCNYQTLERADIRQGIHMHGNKRLPRKFALEPLLFKYGGKCRQVQNTIQNDF